MSTILDQIVANKMKEVKALKERHSMSSLSQSPYFSLKNKSLKAHITSSDFGIIAEIKRKSPSGGDISPHLNPLTLAKSYQSDGALGISVLTDYDYFGGSVEDILAIRDQVSIPILRKEFIIDEIQLFEAKAVGADAILLIAAILDKAHAHHLTIVAQSIGLEVLFEIHSKSELAKINEEVDLIAVNNRNLKVQETSFQHSEELAPFLPDFAPSISASGIKSLEEIEHLKQFGFAGALIGESVLRNGNLATLTGQKVGYES